VNLYRLSLISIAVCFAGLILLLAVTVHSARQINEKQAAVSGLLTLDERIDTFSSASDSLLVLGTDPDLWQAYRAEAADLQGELMRLGADHPDARKAAHRIEVMVEAVSSLLNVPDIGNGSADQGIDIEPLDLPIRSRIGMSQVANQGIALDTALDDVLTERREAIARQSLWTGAVLVFSALLFGALSMVAFGLINRRMTLPARTLAATLEDIRAGDSSARASVSGNNELSRLAKTLNTLLDERDTADRAVRERQDALEQALSQLERAQRIGKIGSWEADFQSDLLECNDQALEIFGITRREFGGSNDDFFKRVHPEDREWVQRENEEGLENGGMFEAEYRILRPDGEVRWVRARTEFVSGPEASASRARGVLQDITDRRRREAETRQFRDLVEGSEDLCCIVDDDYRYCWVNRAYRNRYGSSGDDFEGRPVREVIGDEFFFNELKPLMDRCLAGEPQRFESERTYSGIGERNLLVRYYPLNGHGEAQSLIGAVITDITNVRAAEAELARQTQLLSIAGRAALFGGWSIDLQGDTVAWTDVTAEIHGMPHGYSPSVDEGINFFAPEFRDRLREVFTACKQQGQPYDEELQLIDAEGKRRWVRAVGEPVRGHDGAIVKLQGAIQDITERKALEFESQRLSERMGTMLEAVTDGFIAFDADWRYVYINAEGARMIGKSEEEILGKSLWSQFPGLAGTASEAALYQAKNQGKASAAEEFFEPLDAWFEMRAYPWEDGVAVFFRDVTTYHEMVRQFRAQHIVLQKSRDELDAMLETRQALINSLPAHIALLDHEANIIDVNSQWRHFGEKNDNPDPAFGVGMNYYAICETATSSECGEEAAEISGGLRDVLAGNREAFTLEYPCHAPDEERWFRVAFNRLTSDRSVPGGAVAMHVDVTQRKLAEIQLERLAFEDPLTGLLSRRGFTRELGARLEDSGWAEDGIVVMLDVMNQRDINDAHGYEVGDRLLVELGRRVRAHVGEGGLAGRAGGDEFVIYLDSGAGTALEETLQALEGRLEESFDLAGLAVEIEVWIGFTELGKPKREPDDLVREAEMALFENRSETSAQLNWVGYTTALDQRTRQRIQLTEELRNALDAEEFELHFQPKVSLSDGRMISAEALLRWQHPERGLQPPGLFIPIAEQSQLIGPIGDWVLRDACRQLRDWRAAGLDIVRVSVNVSLVQFALAGFPATVRAALDDFGISPSDLALEITESVFQRQSEALLVQIRELHEMGVRLSLDDFGTGYSSLLYLQKYPFDEIKIDRAFVSRILDDAYSRNIVRTVIEVAAALDAEVVAEGIESREVAEALRELGCNIAQGFYYSMPLEAEDFRWLLEQRSALPLDMEANNDNGSD